MSVWGYKAPCLTTRIQITWIPICIIKRQQEVKKFKDCRFAYFNHLVAQWLHHSWCPRDILLNGCSVQHLMVSRENLTYDSMQTVNKIPISTSPCIVTVMYCNWRTPISCPTSTMFPCASDSTCCCTLKAGYFTASTHSKVKTPKSHVGKHKTALCRGHFVVLCTLSSRPCVLVR